MLLRLWQTHGTMRVVLDTNILISACWTPGGLEAKTVNLALSGALTACVTPPVMAEYRDVLSRGKFAGVRAAASQLLSMLERCAVTFEPGGPIHVSIDDDDNRFLECAAAAQAAYLITGNLRHYPAEWGVTKVVNARAFVMIVS
jgi:uncharacterized protein